MKARKHEHAVGGDDREAALRRLVRLLARQAAAEQVRAGLQDESRRR